MYHGFSVMSKLVKIPPTDLLSQPADLIYFERNLIQLGFFSSTDETVKRPTERRITMNLVIKEGQNVESEIVFTCPSGVANANDLDKWMVFMAFARDQKERDGVLSNPIYFTAYKMIKRQGLADSGSNYAEVENWCKRMYESGITSKHVIWLAASKSYADKNVRVFESYERQGNTADRRSERYAVWLPSWLLNNLNAEYVLLEDLNAYRKLKKPAARGIFVYMHRWFERSGGHTIERDYKKLCEFLGIRAQTMPSRIKRTLGLALDELVDKKYLARWDLQRRPNGDFKVILWPGDGIKRALAVQPQMLTDAQRPPELQLPAKSAETTIEEQEALAALLSLGVTPQRKALQMVKQHDPLHILDLVEYALYTRERDKDSKIRSLAALLVYWLKEDMPVPAEFETSRKRRAAEELKRRSELEAQQRYEAEVAYDAWRDDLIMREMEKRYPGAEREKAINEIIARNVKTDAAFRKIPVEQRHNVGEYALRREVREQMTFPAIEEWLPTHAQRKLF